MPQKLRDVAAADHPDAVALETQIDVTLAEVVGFTLVDFDGGCDVFGLTFSDEYPTMNAEAKFVYQGHVPPLTVLFRTGSDVVGGVHEEQLESPRLFG